MNARLFLAALFFGAFFLAFCLILALWPSADEPEPSRVVSQHAADVKVAELERFFDSLTTTTTAPPTTTTEVARSAPKRTEQNKPPRETRVQATDAWSALAHCESGGNPRAVSKTGRYRGAFQFDLDSYRRAGGTGDPIGDSYAEQLRVAKRWQQLTGWHSWPHCAARLGLI